MLVTIARYVEFVTLGGFCGFLGGLFGIGGATLAIPALGIFFGLTEQLAQGTALVMALPNVAIALVRYARKAQLDLRAAAFLGTSALPFSFFSAAFATSLASRDLRIGFAIFLILIALDIARRALRTGDEAKAMSLPWPFIGVVGAVCGVCSGLFGVGGALIAVPAMTVFFGYSQLAAQGMSLAFAAVTATLTAFVYASKGDVDWTVALALAAGGIFAVRHGVDLAHRLPERRLRLVFVFFMVIMGIALLIKARA